jgi:hypothetical protein
LPTTVPTFVSDLGVINDFFAIERRRTTSRM